MPKRTNLSRERALEAAIAVADTEGIGALTMRRLARELGVEAMSLYHHVTNKDELLDGMVDLVIGEVELPGPDEDWRAGMRRRAISARDVLQRHPWATVLVDSRTDVGPGTWRHHDAVLGCLRGGGFSVALAGHAFSVLDSYVFGYTLVEMNLPFDDPAEAEVLADEMLRQIPVDEYPHLVEFTTEHVLRPGYDYGDEFTWGLELILDGLDRAVAEGAAVSSG